MRPKVFRVAAFDNPNAEEKSVLSALGPFAISEGTHLLIDADRETIIEPALLFLNAKHGRDGVAKADGVASLRSSRASAYDLAAWLRFLARVQRPWQKADHDLIYLYAYNLGASESHLTGIRRKGGTIAHRLAVVYSFYNWFNAAKVTDVRWDKGVVRSAYAGSDKARESCDVVIRPFSPEKIRRLISHLGPLPSELPNGSRRSTRDRLLFETGLLTGMRGEEICHLSAKAIGKLKPDPSSPSATQPLRITITKGRKSRWVALPNDLIGELKLYIAGERARAMTGAPDHDKLFVNLSGRGRGGRPLKTNTIHRRTHALMVRVGLTETDHRTRDGQRVPYTRTLHSFHDTRHSYAVNLYIAQKRAGDSEPWKTVQVMLGHANWLTTEEYYLTAVGVFEPRVGVTLQRYWEGVA